MSDFTPTHYRGYTITRWAPPIPTWRSHLYQFCHTDYDGAPDAHDHRHGSAATVEEAMAEIDAQIEETEEASDLRHDIEDAKRDWDRVTRLDDYET